MTDTPQQPAMPLFHSRIVPVNAELHGTLKLNRDAGFGFAAGATTVPIGIGEFEAAAHSYPVLFTSSSPAVPVVLLGVKAGWNLFVNDIGAWMPGAYVPALVRAFPFAIIDNSTTGTRELGMEADAACISPSVGGPLFEESNPTQLLQGAVAFCNACEMEMNAALAFGAALERAQVLTPQSATIQPTGAPAVTIDGFRVVDRDRLAAVNDDILLAWRSRGWLLPLYSHLFSTANWVPFTELATRQLSMRQ